MEGRTQLGKKCIVFQNNKFRFVRKGVESTSWRCTMKDCRAMIHSNTNGDVLEKSVTHSHIDKVPDVQFDALKTQCKRKAIEHVEARPSKIMREALADMDSTYNVTTGDITNCKLSMYRARKKSFPTLPKSMAETVDKLASLNIQTSRGENMIMTSEVRRNEIAIVSTAWQLSVSL